MDKIFKIKWCEVTKNGNTNGRAWQITKMTLVDEEGVETEGVSTFEAVMNGGSLEGKIVTNDKGYLNFVKKLDAPAFIKQQSNTAFKTQQMEKVMERKERSISGFQDNKEWSIKVSSTMRDAVQLAVTEYNASQKNPDSSGINLEYRIGQWRKWLWNNWDIELEDTDAITGKLN